MPRWAKDVDAMEWAGGNLLKQDWPRQGRRAASQGGRSRRVAVEGAGDRAGQGRAATAGFARSQRERNLVIRLSWGGEADLDLHVKEPSGSVCSCVNRLTVGGGTLIGDMLGAKDSEKNTEMYVNALGFSGKYEITVDKVWGRPLGDKAQLKIVQHQGTDKETSRLITIDLKENVPVTVDLADGRRTEVAIVPPASLQPAPEPISEQLGAGDALSRLRAMASGEVTGALKQASFRGSVGSLGGSTEEVSVEKLKEKDRRRAAQNRISPFVNNNVSFTAQTAIDGDRRYVRMNLNPMFSVVTGTQLKPVVSPVIPGGGGP
jgi:hypothetical protein